MLGTFTTMTAATRRPQVEAQIARQRAADDLRVIRRLAATPEGRQLMANAIDEAREAQRAEADARTQHYLLTA